MTHSTGRPTVTTTRFGSASALALVLVASACSVSIGSTSPEDAGEEAIEEALPDVLGLELSDASCDAPSADEPGETFSCTALTDGGETVTIAGVVEPDDEIFVAASNVVIAADMADVEAEAVATLGPDTGLPPERIEATCPVGPVVLDGDVLMCEISDTATGERFELIVELTDYVLREGWESRRYAVGEPIE